MIRFSWNEHTHTVIYFSPLRLRAVILLLLSSKWKQIASHRQCCSMHFTLIWRELRFIDAETENQHRDTCLPFFCSRRYRYRGECVRIRATACLHGSKCESDTFFREYLQPYYAVTLHLIFYSRTFHCQVKMGKYLRSNSSNIAIAIENLCLSACVECHCHHQNGRYSNLWILYEDESGVD